MFRFFTRGANTSYANMAAALIMGGLKEEEGEPE
jgi:hypothetical protein